MITVSVEPSWAGQGLNHQTATPTTSIKITSFSGLQESELEIFQTRKPVHSVGSLFLNIMVKSYLWGEEELIDVDQPAPQASDHEEDFDWDLLRLNAPAPLPDHPCEIMRPG